MGHQKFLIFFLFMNINNIRRIKHKNINFERVHCFESYICITLIVLDSKTNIV